MDGDLENEGNELIESKKVSAEEYFASSDEDD